MGNLLTRQESVELSNVYIFNRIANNAKDVELLRNTFESLSCVVSEIKVEGKTLKELTNVVKGIVAGDFTNFNYIVIVLLDNENYDEYTWTMEDGEYFHFNRHLLTEITRNKTLSRKLRFCIQQTNRVPGNETIIYWEDCFERTFSSCRKFYPGMELKYYATSTGCALEHNWKDDEPSPFIEKLCNAIEENSQRNEKLTIENMLNQVSMEVSRATGETPSMVPILKPYVLGNARRERTNDEELRLPLNNRS